MNGMLRIYGEGRDQEEKYFTSDASPEKILDRDEIMSINSANNWA